MSTTFTRRTPGRRMSFQRARGLHSLFIVLVGLIVVAGISVSAYATTVVKPYESCTVTRAETFTSSEDGVQKRVYTENCGEFTVNDSLFIGYFTSGSVYGQIEEGETYNFEATGWRWHFPTMFPNIIHAEPAK